MRAVVALWRWDAGAEVGPLAVKDSAAARTRGTWEKYRDSQTNPLNRVLSPNGPAGRTLARSRRREMNYPSRRCVSLRTGCLLALEWKRLPGSSRLRSTDWREQCDKGATPRERPGVSRPMPLLALPNLATTLRGRGHAGPALSTTSSRFAPIDQLANPTSATAAEVVSKLLLRDRHTIDKSETFLGWKMMQT